VPAKELALLPLEEPELLPLEALEEPELLPDLPDEPELLPEPELLLPWLSAESSDSESESRRRTQQLPYTASLGLVEEPELAELDCEPLELELDWLRGLELDLPELELDWLRGLELDFELPELELDWLRGLELDFELPELELDWLRGLELDLPELELDWLELDPELERLPESERLVLEPEDELDDDGSTELPAGEVRKR
jgi:hypothetical protein